MNFINVKMWRSPKTRSMSRREYKRLEETWNNIERIYMNDLIDDTDKKEVIYVESDKTFIINGSIIKENTLTTEESKKLKSKAKKMKIITNNINEEHDGIIL